MDVFERRFFREEGNVAIKKMTYERMEQLMSHLPGRELKNCSKSPDGYPGATILEDGSYYEYDFMNADEYYKYGRDAWCLNGYDNGYNKGEPTNIAYFAKDGGDAVKVYRITKSELKSLIARYPIGTPLYVGTKRVNQAICKVGGVLKTVQGVYVKKDGGIKKIM